MRTRQAALAVLVKQVLSMPDSEHGWLVQLAGPDAHGRAVVFGIEPVDE